MRGSAGGREEKVMVVLSQLGGDMRVRDGPPFDSVKTRVARSRAQLTPASATSEVDLLGTLNKADNILEERGGESIPEEATFYEEKLASENHTQEPAETAKDLLSLLPFAQHSPTLRILIFLPWCPIAGARILLFPTHLERIIFGPGFVSSPQGIYRFAF
ncbi:hypothetical protein C0995_006759 [Termitomyces sp. Mi166|nr:hypothetical protein C0995_006759 [Termitomyces sp. Mi166\